MPIVVEIHGTLGVPGREIPRLESVSLIILILEMAVPLVEIHGVTQRIIPEIRGPVFPPVKPSDESLPSRPRHDLRPLADLFQSAKTSGPPRAFPFILGRMYLLPPSQSHGGGLGGSSAGGFIETREKEAAAATLVEEILVDRMRVLARKVAILH